ncbi:hypothetical protein MPRS_20480 [Mycobacterium paraseoulense]|nr:hypothetical protein MPRS_20480 [Mycobacterium paraseoulense]
MLRGSPCVPDCIVATVTIANTTYPAMNNAHPARDSGEETPTRTGREDPESGLVSTTSVMPNPDVPFNFYSPAS